MYNPEIEIQKVLDFLKEQRNKAGRSEEGRLLAIAHTQIELGLAVLTKANQLDWDDLEEE